MKMTKTKDAPTMGHYELTNVDHKKCDADFRILQVNPYFIRWKSGNCKQKKIKQT